MQGEAKAAGKRMLLFLDNAQIHKCEEATSIAREMGADVLFSAQYSPWLQPIEQLFNNIKR